MILKKIKPGLLILLILLSSSFVYPDIQSGNARFEHLSLDEGAALNLTYCMIQDHKGFLWFGTMYGLVKYDGRDYKIYKNDPDDPNSISFDDIVSLYEDSGNNIWIGTWGGGLNKLDPETGKVTRFVNDSKTNNGISDNIVWTICEDLKGNIWFGTETAGLDKYIPQTNTFVHYTHRENNPKSIPVNFIRNIYRDQNGTLWICSRSGLTKYLEETDSFITYKTGNNLPVETAAEDKNGRLWAGTPGGLYVLDKSKDRLVENDHSVLKDKFIYTLCVKDNYIWIGTNKGLYKLNPDSEELTEYRNEPGDPYSLSGNNILNIIGGSSGILWINSYGNGISKLRSLPSRFTSFTNQPGNNKSLSSNSVTAFCADDQDNIWIGTSNGLNKFNKQKKIFERFSSDELARVKITSLVSNKNYIWIGTVKGLKIFNRQTGKFMMPPHIRTENKVLNDLYINSINDL